MEKELTAEQSLEIIQSMVQSSRKRVLDDGFIYMLWGIAVTLAALYQFFMIQAGEVNGGIHALGWAVLMPIAGIITGFRVAKMNKEAKVRTHFDEVMSLLWPSFTAMLVILIFMGITNIMDWSLAYPIIIGLYGMATFISGGLLKSPLMQVGAASCWVIAIVATQLDFQYQLLLLVVAVWLSYMIPGLVLNFKAKKANV